jgi:hypothetical protein
MILHAAAEAQDETQGVDYNRRKSDEPHGGEKAKYQ